MRLHIDDTNNLVFHLNFNRTEKLTDELRSVFTCRIIQVIHYSDWAFWLLGNMRRLRKMLNCSSEEHDLKITESMEKDRLTYLKADRIVCLSEFMREVLCRDYLLDSNKISVIPNGLNDLSLVDRTGKVLLKQKYHLSTKSSVILFAGRLDEIKGLEYAIRAFKTVRKHFPYLHMIISGDGKYDTYLKECDSDRIYIHFTGFLPQKQLYELYEIADIGVIPSFHEQCSYVAIEMMMHGLPIIGSTTMGLKEMIVDGETGLHIPVIEHSDRVEIDTDLFAEKIQYLLQNTGKRQYMGKNARKRYELFYSGDVFRNNMLRFYNINPHVKSNAINLI
jgi:glycosyltransferase